MGQKTHPYGFRLGYNRTWHSRWYADQDYAKILGADLSLREDLKKQLKHAGVSEIDIERAAERLRVTIYTSRPGIIIGRKGAEVDRLRDYLMRKMGRPVHINIQEIQRPELDAQLVAENIAQQLVRRISFRRAMKKAMESAFRFGGKGIKIMVAGRLNGNEIARTEWYQEGRLPLHTLKADVDYGLAEAGTTYGKIGVKVWVYKGDLLKEKSRRAS
ncbi:MAG: 30S ribosomal protein S3 [Thermoanaerobaculia bacterium]|jgi:small subunit ribosomal protein S3|nr:30S ribosomal protein S3 [Thermoanaerobaculia bacterium]